MTKQTATTKFFIALLLLGTVAGALWFSKPKQGSAQNTAIDVEVENVPNGFSNWERTIDQLTGSEFFGVDSLENRARLWLQLPSPLSSNDIAINDSRLGILLDRARRDQDELLNHQSNNWRYNVGRALGEQTLLHLNGIVESLYRISNERIRVQNTAGDRDCGLSPTCYLAKTATIVAEGVAYVNGWIGETVMVFAINQSIEQFRAWADLSGGVHVAWATIRNFANLGLIFMLLYAAAGLVFNLKLDAKQTISYVIIVALLINFSAVLVGLVIDAANVLALGIFNLSGRGFAEKLVQLMSLPPAVNDTGIMSLGVDVASLFNSALAILFSLISIFVLGTISLLLIIRAVRLLILLVVSPLAFVAYTNPKTEKWGKEWTQMLLSDAFFAPTVFLMIHVSLTLGSAITDALKTNPPATGADAFTISVFRIVIMTIFLVASLVIAKKMGAGGTDWAMKTVGRTLAGSFGRTLAGSFGFMGRQTVGRMGHKFANSKLAAKWENARGVTGWVGRLARRGSEQLGKSSFDFRASKTAKRVMKFAGVAEGLGGGKAQKGGFEASEEAKQKETGKVIKNIETKLGPAVATDFAARMYRGEGPTQIGLTSAQAGLIAGGALGSIVPGVGTVIGGAVGGAAGGALGSLYGRYIRGKRARLEAEAEEYRQKALWGRRTDDVNAAQIAEARANKLLDKAKKITLTGVEKAAASYGKFDEKALQQAIGHETEKEVENMIKELKEEVENATKNLSQAQKENVPDQAKITGLEKRVEETNKKLELLVNRDKKTVAEISNPRLDELKHELKIIQDGRSKEKEESAKRRALKDLGIEISKTQEPKEAPDGGDKKEK